MQEKGEQNRTYTPPHKATTTSFVCPKCGSSKFYWSVTYGTTIRSKKCLDCYGYTTKSRRRVLYYILAAVIAVFLLLSLINSNNDKNSVVSSTPDNTDIPVVTEPPTTTTLAPATTTTVSIETTAWPTSAQDGPPALYTLFGANFDIPDWVACEQMYCLAGSGNTISVYTLSPLEQLGSFDGNVPSPYQKLIELQFTDQQARDLLSRG